MANESSFKSNVLNYYLQKEKKNPLRKRRKKASHSLHSGGPPSFDTI
jgi:hypothetical protein